MRAAELGLAASCAALLYLAAGCGARSDLAVPEPGLDTPFDGAFRRDGGPLTDAERDASPVVDGSVDPDGSLERPDASTPDAGPTCREGDFALSQLPVDLVLLLDGSESMGLTMAGSQPNPERPSRWELMEWAIRDLDDSLHERVSLGLKLLPGGFGIDECDVTEQLELPLARRTYEDVLSSIRSREPGGGTPVARAVRVASRFLGARDAARAMVLVSDGVPTCHEDAQERALEALTIARRELGASIWVVGIADSEGEGVALDALAIAGGRARPTTPRFYPVNDDDSFSEAMWEATGEATRCVYPIPGGSVSPDAEVVVSVDDNAVPQDRERVEGWDFSGPRRQQIGFHGEACALLRRSSVSIEARIRCP